MTSTLVELLEESRRRGFLGPGPVESHLDHARAFAVAVDRAPASAVDLGAGGGLPGLVLAVEFWPECRWLFLDAQQRRTDFLREAIAELGVAERVEVVTERAEVIGQDPDHRGHHDLVVARSFGGPGVVAECAAPLLVVGGHLVVSEPPGAELAQRWPATALATLGCSPAQPVVVDAPGRPVHLVQISQVAACDDRYPRRVGVPAKRPLF